MIKQVIIGFATEGSTDNRFLESVIQRTFEDVAFECDGEVEVLPVQSIEKQNGAFTDLVESYARLAAKRGVMVLCIHADADSGTDENAFTFKVDPAFVNVKAKEESENSICKNLVAVIPVRMTEAWMMSDKHLLKEEIGTNQSDQALGLEHFPESYTDPKQVIIDAIRISRQDLPRRRRNDLTIDELYLPIGQKTRLNHLERLPSYQKFRMATRNAFKALNYLRD